MNAPKIMIVLLALVVIIEFSYCIHRDANVKANNNDTAFRYEYVNGQVLYPEYDHADTLIVTNARGLNAAMQTIHDNLQLNQYGDSQYDSLFHQYCKVDNTPMEYDYKLNIHNDTMWLYTKDNKPVGMILSNYTSPLDSLIIKDNE